MPSPNDLKLPEQLQVRPFLHTYSETGGYHDYSPPLKSNELIIRMEFSAEQLTGYDRTGKRIDSVPAWDVPSHLQDAIYSGQERNANNRDKSPGINSDRAYRPGHIVDVCVFVSVPEGWSNAQFHKVLEGITSRVSEEGGIRTSRNDRAKMLVFDKFVSTEQLTNIRGFVADHLSDDLFKKGGQLDSADIKAVSAGQLVGMVKSLTGTEPHTSWQDVGTDRHDTTIHKPLKVDIDPIKAEGVKARASSNPSLHLPSDPQLRKEVMATAQAKLDQDYPGYKLGEVKGNDVRHC